MTTPRVRLRSVDFFVLNMRTRMPFKYGIASLSALPHLMVRVEADVAGRPAWGVSAEGLPPKWFTKDPATSFAGDLQDMLAVIRHAARAAVEAGERASVFDWWLAVQEAQAAWARGRGHPPLLAGLGTSLMERAMIEAVCRSLEQPFARLLQANAWGLRLGHLHPELAGREVAACLPGAPLRRVAVRHTVGLADPLEDADIPPAERLDDGLPQSLAAAIRRHGLRWFKVKVSGRAEADLDRLTRWAAVLSAAGVEAPRWTLDGNEQFGSVEAFREFWERFRSAASLVRLQPGLIVVEQPLARSVALDEATGRALRGWTDRPPMIIDESDGEPGSLAVALRLGYAGTSHKNCKGVFRGVAHGCLVAEHRRKGSGSLHLTSEDLASVGPVAMPSDLTVAACLGLEHSERNGHHYFRGLSMFPEDLQDAVVRAHGDLFERSAAGFATLRIRDGWLETGSLLAAPFGSGVAFDPRRFTPLDAWTPDSLEI